MRGTKTCPECGSAEITEFSTDAIWEIEFECGYKEIGSAYNEDYILIGKCRKYGF